MCADTSRKVLGSIRQSFFLTPWQDLREVETPGLDYRVFFLVPDDQARRPTAALAADADAPASLFSTHSAAFRAESTAPEISDSGPIESVFAKKTRSSGWLAAGMIFVKVPGVATNIGCPRR